MLSLFILQNKCAIIPNIILYQLKHNNKGAIYILESKWQIMTEDENKILINKLEIRIIEIPKARKIIKEAHNKIAQWMMFFG